jgi:TPR repeat protein
VDDVERLYRRVVDDWDLQALLALLDDAEPAELRQLFLADISEGNTEAMYCLAVLFSCEDPPEAERWLRRVLDLDEGNAKAKLHLAWLLSENGRDIQEVRDLNRQAAEADNAAAYYEFGMILRVLGQVEMASEFLVMASHRGEPRAASMAEMIYQKAIDDGETRAYNSLAILLADRGDLDGAEHYFRRAIEAGDSRAAGNLTLLLRERDRKE